MLESSSWYKIFKLKQKVVWKIDYVFGLLYIFAYIDYINIILIKQTSPLYN